MRKFDQNTRILAVSFSTKGLGYAIFEGMDTYVDWGFTRVTGSRKNLDCLTVVSKLVSLYTPSVLLMEDVHAKTSKRRDRIRNLVPIVDDWAKKNAIRVQKYSRTKIAQLLCGTESATKHEVALKITERFPEEMPLQVPTKRKTYESEDPRMDVFGALGLVLGYRILIRGRPSNESQAPAVNF